jgi:hypothetical protein
MSSLRQLPPAYRPHDQTIYGTSEDLPVPVSRPSSGYALTVSRHLHGYVQQRCGQAQRCDRQRESAGRHSHGKTDQRWDYGGTERGCRSLESGQAVRDRS